MQFKVRILSALMSLSFLASCGHAPMQGLQTFPSQMAAKKLSAQWVLKKQSPHVPGELVVQMKTGFRTQSIGIFSAVAPQTQTQSLHIEGQEFALLKLKRPQDSVRLMQDLRQDPAVARVEYNPRYQALTQTRPWRAANSELQPGRPLQNNLTLPNDAFFPIQWALPKIGIPEAWKYTRGKEDVLVAVIDSGVDYNHPDLKGQIINGLDYMPEQVNGPNGEGSPDVVDDDPMDHIGHGTHVAGIIGAIPDNQTGVAGIAPNVKVLNIRVLGSEGWGSAFAIAQGITYAVDHGAKVLNLSLGSPQGSKPIELAIQYALKKGVLVVAAAGNDFTHTGYPASYPGVLAVGATTDQDWLADFTNHDQRIDVMAPGVDIMSTTPTFLSNSMADQGVDSYYSVMSGTSMASPMVAAQAALIMSQRPDLNAEQVKDIIKTSAKKIGDPRLFGHGRIQIPESLQMAQLPPPAQDPLPPPVPAQAGLNAQRMPHFPR